MASRNVLDISRHTFLPAGGFQGPRECGGAARAAAHRRGGGLNRSFQAGGNNCGNAILLPAAGLAAGSLLEIEPVAAVPLRAPASCGTPARLPQKQLPVGASFEAHKHRRFASDFASQLRV